MTERSTRQEVLEGFVVDQACLRKYPQDELFDRAREHTKQDFPDDCGILFDLDGPRVEGGEHIDRPLGGIPYRLASVLGAPAEVVHHQHAGAAILRRRSGTRLRCPCRAPEQGPDLRFQRLVVGAHAAGSPGGRRAAMRSARSHAHTCSRPAARSQSMSSRLNSNCAAT